MVNILIIHLILLIVLTKKAYNVCPHQESNLDLFLRTELLYPLSYEGKMPVWGI